MINSLVAWLVGLLLPKAPSWVATLLTAALPAIVDLVGAVQDLDADGQAKFSFIVDQVGSILDEAFDGVPEWALYPEEGRDKIIGGFTELAVFVNTVIKTHGKKKGVKQVVKALKRIDITKLK